MKELRSFIFEEERAVPRNGLVFDDVWVSKHQETRHTYDAVAYEAREEIRYNKRYLVFHCVVHQFS